VQTDGNEAPKYQKCPLFGKESPRRGDSLDRFPKFSGAFIRLTIHVIFRYVTAYACISRVFQVSSRSYLCTPFGDV